MYHIIGKVHELELKIEDDNTDTVSAIILVDKSWVRERDGEHFVPYVFSSKQPGLIRVDKQGEQEQKFKLTVKNCNKLIALLSNGIGKTVKINFIKKTLVGPEIDESSIKNLVITE